MSPEYLSVEDVAEYISAGVSTVWTYIRQWRASGGAHGLGPSYRLSARQIRFKREDVDRWMAQFREEAPHAV